MEYSEACEALVNEIQKGKLYPFQYARMLMSFMNAKTAGETNRMSLALAINEAHDGA